MTQAIIVHSIEQPTIERDSDSKRYRVGMRCSFTGTYFWKDLTARRFVDAQREAKTATQQLLRESADRWKQVAKTALHESRRLLDTARQLGDYPNLELQDVFPLEPTKP